MTTKRHGAARDPVTGKSELATSAVNLTLLLDTLDALETEIEALPEPPPLFARELAQSLAEALVMAVDG